MGQTNQSSVSLEARGLKLAIIVSRYNPSICQGLLQGALQALQECGIAEAEVQIEQVPGAFEIPLTAQWLARTQNFDGLLCLGTVIRGGTPHFEYVCEAVTQGLNQVMLEESIPLGFGILTTDTLRQAEERSAPNENNKGRETARTVIEMVLLKKKIAG